MKRATACIIAFSVFVIATVFTILLAHVVNTHNIPVSNLGVIITMCIPVSLYAIFIAIAVKLWRE